MRLINADTVVHWQTYDDEHETFPEHTGTIADFLDQMTDEGCPGSVDAVPVRRGRWIHHDSNDNHVPPYDECDQCGWKVRIGLNFCPHCGAKNRKDGEAHENH